MAKTPVFSSQFRSRFSEKIMELGNFAAAGLLIGQFASDKGFFPELLLLGFILTVLCYIIGYIVSP